MRDLQSWTKVCSAFLGHFQIHSGETPPPPPRNPLTPQTIYLATEETVSKYAVFCAKFLRCAIETLKNVKAKEKGLIEVTDALKLGKIKHVNIFSCCLEVRSFLSSQNKLNVYS